MLKLQRLKVNDWVSLIIIGQESIDVNATKQHHRGDNATKNYYYFFAWRDQQLVFWEDIINWVLKNMPKPKQARQSDQLSFQGEVSYQLIPFPIDYK